LTHSVYAVYSLYPKANESGELMLEKLKEFWTRLKFLFKPTYYVVAEPQQALDLVARRGGTVRFCAGTFMVPSGGLIVPDQDVRIIGAHLQIPEGGTGMTVHSGKHSVHIIGCIFEGMGPGPGVVIEVPKDPKP
jgi:hypothetical protein